MQDFSDYLKYLTCEADADYKALIAKLRSTIQEYKTLEELKRDIEIIYTQSL